MKDQCVRAKTSDHLEVTVAMTSRTCRTAQDVHQLSGLAAVALGRLMTCAGLIALTSKKPGKTSLQILSRAPLGQAFCDATEGGDLRGMVKNPSPSPTADHAQSARRTVSALVYPGKISVVRRGANGEYVQSMTPLHDGEVDADVQSFLEQSDQVPTGLAAECLLDGDERVLRAGGVMIQALPDGDFERLRTLRARIASGGLVPLLQEAISAEDLLSRFEPTAVTLGEPVPLRWHCPCSFERATNAVKLLGPNDLSSLVVEEQPLAVECDFCASRYEISVKDLERLMKETVVAEG
ncbi:MAG: Hsp33 family molecular chaperone HslO [Myxococcota bacterium]